ncbi:MAG: gspE [Candidatus Paceibacter sp.]|nr:gspE [Candidatus Paceibacter sp.]
MQASAVDILYTTIVQAYTEKASDIHIDPQEIEATIKFRVDGYVSLKNSIPPSIHNDLIGRIKVLANLRTDEHMAPQDCRCRITLSYKKFVDVRVSIVPSYYGESAVLRLLADTTSIPSLIELGMCDEDQKKIHKVLAKSSGMILVTGPTGSGKTTTLYTLLKMLNSGKKTILTIEDPIEYAIPGIRQIQINRERGLSFATGLRAMVRQDPDIIMVGEIRDAETASIAIHIALTGHLLLATLHTHDAATAIPRLIDMGIDPYLVASTIGLVIAQRLIRRACPHCSAGCTICNGESYQGRVGIFEVLSSEEHIQNAILSRAPAKVLRAIATEHGMRTLEHDGLEKVERGITRIEEVIAAIID